MHRKKKRKEQARHHISINSTKNFIICSFVEQLGLVDVFCFFFYDWLSSTDDT